MTAPPATAYHEKTETALLGNDKNSSDATLKKLHRYNFNKLPLVQWPKSIAVQMCLDTAYLC